MAKLAGVPNLHLGVADPVSSMNPFPWIITSVTPVIGPLLG